MIGRDKRVRVALILACAAVLVLVGWTAKNAEGSKVVVDDLPVPRDSHTTSVKKDVPRPVRIAVIGDTFVTGTALGGAGEANWTRILTAKLKEADRIPVTIDVSGHPGSGYVSRGADQLTYEQSLAKNARSDDDIVVIFSSARDYGQRTDVLTEAASQAIKTARKRAPSAKVVVVGPPISAGFGQLVRQDTVAVLAKASRDGGATFVDPLSEKWFQGDNADLIGKDRINPRNSGHRLIAAKMYDALRATVKRAAGSKPLPPGAVLARESSFDRAGMDTLLSVDMKGPAARAVRGDCDSGVTPYLELSLDGKTGFVGVPSPVSEVLDLSVSRSGRISLVGLDDSCKIASMQSLEPGGFGWLVADASLEWFLSQTKGRVHSPRGEVKPGCSKVLSLSVLTDSIVRAACTDGTIRGTMNGGRTWKRLGKLPGLRTIDFSSPSVGVALSAFEGCATQASLTRDGGNSWKRGACIAGDRAEAITYNDIFWIAQTSGAFYSSSDNGTTWSPYPKSPK